MSDDVMHLKYAELSRIEKWAVDRMLRSTRASWLRLLLVVAAPFYFAWNHGWDFGRGEVVFFTLLALFNISEHINGLGVWRLLRRLNVVLMPGSRSAA